MAEQRFAVATFKRVFDTAPTRDTIGLDALRAGLTRFILKPKPMKAVRRDVQRVEQAWNAYERGERLGGRRWSCIIRAHKRGGRAAAERTCAKMLSRAKGRAKTDLRLWSPALYRDGGRRESADVVHLSCLVLDYDGGTTPEDAADQWSGYFRIVHTTWSHEPESPRFRLILPLAHPVRAEDWQPFWTWAAERVGMANDPSLKSPASTFALPVVRSRSWPRQAFVRSGPLFSPLDEGRVPQAAAPPPALPKSGPNHWDGDDADYRTVEQASPPLAGAQPPPTDDDFALFGPPDEPAPPDWDAEFEGLF